MWCTIKLLCILIHCDLLDRNGPQLPQYLISKHGVWPIAFFGQNWAKTKCTGCVFIQQALSDGRACKTYFFGNVDKSYRCLYEQNNHKQMKYKLASNTIKVLCVLLHCDLLDRNGPQLPQCSLSKQRDWLIAFIG